MDLQEFSEKAIRHGEVMLTPIDALPTKAKLISERKSYIVGRSETGHHHVLTAPALRVYELDNELYLDVRQVGELEHKKTYEKHQTRVVNPGFYKVQVKHAFDYFKKAMTRVQD